MAFDFNNLIINRNTFISPDKIIDNNYFSNDSIKTIESPNYFPAYFGFDDNSVVIGDCIKIISTSDNLIKEYMVISVNPLVLSNVSAPGMALGSSSSGVSKAAQRCTLRANCD